VGILPQIRTYPLSFGANIEYTVKKGDTLWDLAVKKVHVHAKALIKDNEIQEPRKLQPGRKLKVRLPSYPREKAVVAGWYEEASHNRPMANGEPFGMYANTIAHKDFPLWNSKIRLQVRG